MHEMYCIDYISFKNSIVKIYGSTLNAFFREKKMVSETVKITNQKIPTLLIIHKINSRNGKLIL